MIKFSRHARATVAALALASLGGCADGVGESRDPGPSSRAPAGADREAATSPGDAPSSVREAEEGGETPSLAAALDGAVSPATGPLAEQPIETDATSSETPAGGTPEAATSSEQGSDGGSSERLPDGETPADRSPDAPIDGLATGDSSGEEAPDEEDAAQAPPVEGVVRIAAPAEREVPAGTLARFPIQAFAGESSRPRLTLLDAPPEASLRKRSDGGSEFLWQTSASDVGETLVTIEARAEDDGARASASVLLRVLPAPVPDGDARSSELDAGEIDTEEDGASGEDEAGERTGEDAGAGEGEADEVDREDAESASSADTASGLDASSPLRELARAIDLRIGFAAYHDLEGDLFSIPDAETYADLATTEYDIVTPENSMKMTFVQPERGRFDWDMADRVVDFAESVGMAVHGHALVWRQQNPRWARELDHETRGEAMREHVAALVSRYRGRVAVWDVVNEALEDDGQLIHTIWYRALGEDYFGEAFRIAHEHDPDATLIYNDYAVNVANPKSDAMHALLERELARGTPVHGVGMQMHLNTDTTRFEAMRENMRRFAALGLDVYITEMDVSTDWRADPDIEAERQAQVYAEVLRVCLEEPRCRALQTWGLSDRHAWRGALSALPFDVNFAPKPAVAAMREVMLEFVESGARSD